MKKLSQIAETDRLTDPNTANQTFVAPDLIRGQAISATSIKKA
jgi:hypothetical protein